MSIPGSASPLFFGAGAGEAAAFQIDRSIRINSADSAYLNRTPSSASNRKKWTYSLWAKLQPATIGGYNLLWSCTPNGSSGDQDALYIDNSTDQMILIFNITDPGGSNLDVFKTERRFRDPSAWYHIVLRYDATASSNYVKLYINGVEETDFATDNRNNSNLSDHEAAWNSAGEHRIGKAHANSDRLNGYLTEINFVDGQALDPTSFGEFDDNNVWQPIDTSELTFGTNGFRLKFDDNSSNAALGNDSSGNDNDWTVNNLSVASGTGNDSLIDTPTNYTVDSGNAGGNYCTWNPLQTSAATLSNGNLDLTSTGVLGCRSTFAASSGKWYFEVTCLATGGGGSVGVMDYDEAFATGDPGNKSYGWGFINTPSNSNFTKKHNNSASTMSSPGALAVGDVFGVAYDLDSGKIWFSKNGTYGEGDPSAGTGASYTNLSGRVGPAAGNGSSAVAWAINAGQRSFSYTPPTNFLSLCTQNLPDPTIADGSTAFDIALYTGTRANQVLTFGMQPDFVWAKNRSTTAYNHVLTDSVRGAQKVIFSNLNNAEQTSNSIIDWDYGTNQVQLGDYGQSSETGDSYVAWAWDAGSSTVSNTDGSITSSVRANASAGFSIVTYTGNGTAGATVGHSLNAAPELVLYKTRDSAIDWIVYHEYANASPAGGALFLNKTNGFFAGGAQYFNNTKPSSSVLTLGTNTGVNTNNDDYVAYCLAPVDQFSAFGVYTGNGSTDGTFVYTGFRPRWIMYKPSNRAATDWVVWDTERNPYNIASNYLLANSSNAEGSVDVLDILSNGFKLRVTSTGNNGSGDEIIYAAFAEHPFKTARAR
tara:strand:+ start:672 stop:3125 length:2454 start_codon:yes stop_codon:yes gene_type:complete